MVDQLAARGFVTLAVGWQTFEQAPSDDVVNGIRVRVVGSPPAADK